MRTTARRRSAAVAIVATLGASAGTARAQQPAAPPHGSPFEGAWQGVLRPPAPPLRVTLAVRRDSTGALVGTLGSPDQTTAQIPARVAVRGDTLVATAEAAGVTYTAVLDAARDSLRGTFAQGGAALPLALGRSTGAAGNAQGAPPPLPTRRPQDPAPPFPYRDEEVAIESVPGVRLAGTLSVPPGRGPFPAVVFVTGSGPQNRDEELVGHRPFRVIADRLARAGVATLRYDDRGVGRSTGAFASATTADLADDAQAAVRFLRTRPGIARDRIGILGHSEGGAIGPLVAARTGDVAFLVLLAGPGVPGDSLLVLQSAALASAAGAPPPVVARQSAMQRGLFAAVRGAGDSATADRRVTAVIDSVVAVLPADARRAAALQLAQARAQVLSPWFRYFIAYDPEPALRRVRVPVLALNGTRDLQVPAAENLAGIRTALAAAGNRDHTEVALDGLNHLFQTARTGLPTEYGAIDETVAPAALDRIVVWVTTRFVRRR